MYDKLTDHTYALLLCQQDMNENIVDMSTDGEIVEPVELKAALLKNITGVRELLQEFEATVNTL
jgi:hypothetical protein